MSNTESEKHEDPPTPGPLGAGGAEPALPGLTLHLQSARCLPGVMHPHHPVTVILQRRWRALAAGGGSQSGEVAQQGC